MTLSPVELTSRPPAVFPLPAHLRAPMRAVYAAAGTLVAVPLFQAAPLLIPLEPLTAAWRYGAYSVLAGGVLAPAGGVLLAHWVAALDDNRPVQLASAAVAIVAGAALLAGAPLFLHDYLQLRDAAAPQLRGSLDSAAWRALFAGVVAGAALLWIGRTGWTSALTPPPGQIRKKGGKGGLVVAQRALGTDLEALQAIAVPARSDSPPP